MVKRNSTLTNPQPLIPLQTIHSLLQKCKQINDTTTSQKLYKLLLKTHSSASSQIDKCLLIYLSICLQNNLPVDFFLSSHPSTHIPIDLRIKVYNKMDPQKFINGLCNPYQLNESFDTDALLYSTDKRILIVLIDSLVKIGDFDRIYRIMDTISEMDSKKFNEFFEIYCSGLVGLEAGSFHEEIILKYRKGFLRGLYSFFDGK